MKRTRDGANPDDAFAQTSKSGAAAAAGDEEKPSKQAARCGFDPETGALERPMKSYRPPGPSRGYGKSPALDAHPLLHPQITLVVAPTGGGKSTLMLNLLEEIITNVDRKRLGKVLFYTGSPQDPLMMKLNKRLVQVFGPEQTESFLSELRLMQLDMMNEEKSAGACKGLEAGHPLSIVVMDDGSNNKELTPTQTKGTEIGEFFMRHRHMGIHFIISAQRWMSLPTFLRANLSHLFLFSGKSKGELSQILSGIDLPTQQLEKAAASIASKPHEFMWINLRHRTAMIGFDKVVLR